MEVTDLRLWHRGNQQAGHSRDWTRLGEYRRSGSGWVGLHRSEACASREAKTAWGLPARLWVEKGANYPKLEQFSNNQHRVSKSIVSQSPLSENYWILLRTLVTASCSSLTRRTWVFLRTAMTTYALAKDKNNIHCYATVALLSTLSSVHAGRKCTGTIRHLSPWK